MPHCPCRTPENKFDPACQGEYPVTIVGCFAYEFVRVERVDGRNRQTTSVGSCALTEEVARKVEELLREINSHPDCF